MPVGFGALGAVMRSAQLADLEGCLSARTSHIVVTRDESQLFNISDPFGLWGHFVFALRRES
jgi:hypothetical protein